MALRRAIVWIDVGGRTRLTIPEADATIPDIMAALENHSTAAVYEYFQGPNITVFGTPTGGFFADVRDLARLTFQTPTGKQVNLAVPAPQVAMFLADQTTVDPSAIADIISACVGHLTTATGETVTSYVAGVRAQRGSGF